MSTWKLNSTCYVCKMSYQEISRRQPISEPPRRNLSLRPDLIGIESNDYIENPCDYLVPRPSMYHCPCDTMSDPERDLVYMTVPGECEQCAGVAPELPRTHGRTVTLPTKLPRTPRSPGSWDWRMRSCCAVVTILMMTIVALVSLVAYLVYVNTQRQHSTCEFGSLQKLQTTDAPHQLILSKDPRTTQASTSVRNTPQKGSKGIRSYIGYTPQ